MVKYNNIKANTKKADTVSTANNTIRPQTLKAETITSNTPRPTREAPSNPNQSPSPQVSTSKPRAAQTRSTVNQTLSKAPPPAPPIPKDPKPNLAQLSHSPGALTSQKRIEAQQTQKPVEDVITASIVGNDFRTGETKVKDGSGNIYSVQIGTDLFRPSGGIGGIKPASAVVGQSVIISRSRSQSGERTVRFVSLVPLGQNPQDALSSFANIGNINDLCKPSGSSSTSQNPKDKPETPEEAEVPPPLTEPSPNEPEPEDDPPSKPFGCNPDDDAQWYNGETCPAGLISLGFAQLSDGSFKTLCRGPNLPPGDGCPTSPDEYGWICSGGVCEYVPFGLYTTKAECEGVCTPPEEEIPEIPLSGFTCNDGTCIEDTVNPQFETLEACNASRTPIYGPPPFEGGQCNAEKYVVSITGFSGGVFAGDQTLLAFGPIGGVRATYNGSAWIVELNCRGLNPSATDCSGSVGSLLGQAWYSTGLGLGSSFSPPRTASINSASICEPPDDCGDPLGPIEGYTC